MKIRRALFCYPILAAVAFADTDFYRYSNYDPDLAENSIAYDGFASPSGMARPQTWWHWMNGNVSREGIRRDLGEMADKGYGAASVFSLRASLKGSVDYASKEWLDLWSYSVETAAGLGMDIGMNNCDGWSEAGGPWITPEHSMKVTTWSLTRVQGDGQEQTLTLAQPESKHDYYRDVAVIMWPARRPEKLKMEGQLEEVLPATAESVVPANAGTILFDGKRHEVVRFNSPRPVFGAYGVMFKFKEPVEVGVLYGEILLHVEPPTRLFLEASDDGVDFKKVAQIEFAKPSLYKAFEPAKARYWRLIKYFDENPGPRTKSGLIGQNVFSFKELELLAPGECTRMGSCISELPQKAGLVDLSDKTFSFEAAFDQGDAVIGEAEIVVVKNAVGADGKFTWDVPAGEWEVMRLGYTTTGHTTSPATPAGKGLELDKFSKAAVDFHFDRHIQRFVDAAGGQAGKAFKYVLTDSWECGAQNWTQGFEKIFEKENGYDILKFAPALTGVCVGDRETTENFLCDYRNTMARLVFENFYGRMRERVNAAAPGLMYESEPSGEVFMRDQIRGFKHVDIPMSESWQKPREIGRIPEPAGRQTYIPAQTAARFYGKRYNAHETLTNELGNWAETPLLLKAVVDQALLTGANMLVFHSFVHQPDERHPGWAMEPHGTALNRKLTWWPFSKPFFNYISRVQYMSQHGKLCARVLFLTSDEVPSAASSSVNPPKDVLFDMITGDGVRENLRVVDGRLVCPGKIAYEMLSVVPEANLTLGTLRQLKKYVQEGAVISGFYQTEYRTLVGGEAGKKEWQKLNEEIFGAPGQKEIRVIGKGRVFANYLCEEAASQTGMKPSIKIADENGGASKVYWFKREHADGTAWYWLLNGSGDRRELVVDCDVTGKNVQVWNPETGSRSDVAASVSHDGFTSVPVSLDPCSSTFLVFGGGEKMKKAVELRIDGRERFPVLEKDDTRRSVPAPVLSATPDGNLIAEFFQKGSVEAVFDDGSRQEIAVDSVPSAVDLRPPFTVEFDEKFGGLKSAVFDRLDSWTKHNDARIKNYSGIAKYIKEVEVPSLAGGTRTYLEFDKIAEVARIVVNGTEAGVLWKMPYRLEITGALKAGKNLIEVEVANTWVNRCLYDATLPQEQRLTWSNSMESHYPNPDKIGSGLSRRAWNQGPVDSGIMGGLRMIFSRTSTSIGSAGSGLLPASSDHIALE